MNDYYYSVAVIGDPDTIDIKNYQGIKTGYISYRLHKGIIDYWNVDYTTGNISLVHRWSDDRSDMQTAVNEVIECLNGAIIGGIQ